MMRLLDRLIGALSSVLTADQQDAVLGDIAELGLTRTGAVRTLLGFVVRYRLRMVWRGAIFLMVALAASVVLYREAAALSMALTANVTLLLSQGVRYENFLSPTEDAFVFICQSAALMTWSWALGAVARYFAGKNIWVRPLFVLSLGVVLIERSVQHNFFPTLFEALLLFFPFLLGLTSGFRAVARSRVWVAAGIGWMTLVTALAFWTGGWWQAAIEKVSGGAWHGGMAWKMRLLSTLLASLPAWYALFAADSRLRSSGEQQCAM